MIDIHHHLLPGVDDGPREIEESIAMVRMAAEDGVTHIVATPHANHQFTYERAVHEAGLQALRDALPDDLGRQIKLGLGCDFHLTYDNVEAAKQDKSFFSINGKGYLMVELPDIGIPRNTGDVLYELRLAGLTPVLTHPERNATIQRNLDILIPWMQAELLLQVTAGSVTGVFGKQAQKVAHELLRRNWVHVIASDAHSTERRNPKLSEAYAQIARQYGEDTARRLFVTNPLAAFEGRALDAQPEPLGIFEDMPERPWWQRLLGR